MSTPEQGWNPRFESETFNDVLVEQLRNTPWVLISGAIHLVIALVLHFVATTEVRAQEVKPIEVSAADVPEEELPEQPEDVDDQPPLEAPKEPEEHHPVDVDDEPPEMDTQDPTDEPKDADDAENDRPFDSINEADATIGLGPGAPGAEGRGPGGNEYHGRRKPRGRDPTLDPAFDWLALHQSEDGRWDCDGFMRNGDPGRGALCDGAGTATYDVGVTGLALLAYLGAGHTHREGPYRATVRAALKWLKRQQDAEGCFGPRGDPHFTYNHSIAALAMAEAYGMTRSGLWKGPAQNGINFVMKCQNPYKAWRYGVRPGDNDTSVTGWMVMALKSAKMSGLDVNDTALQWARDFIVEMTDEETGRTGYTKRGERPVRAEGRQEQFPADTSEALTAVGMLTRIFAGEDPKTCPMIKAGAELCAKRLPTWEPTAGKVDMYYWYYATLAMFQVGGREWAAWNHRMRPAIIKTQRGDGNFAGSWDPVGPWGEDGGRVYSTAVMTLCMEVYFRYPRVFGVR